MVSYESFPSTPLRFIAFVLVISIKTYFISFAFCVLVIECRNVVEAILSVYKRMTKQTIEADVPRIDDLFMY